MDATQRIKQAAATLVVGLLLAIGFAAPAQADNWKPQGMTAQQWQAEKARADATNRYYHLGKYSPQAQALQAEKRKFQAVDRYYHLGKYAVVAPSNPFDWADAAIGAGAMLGALLLTGGLATVAIRRRADHKPSFPSTI
jgi:hypothetical protein